MKEKVVLLVVRGLGTTAKDLDKSLNAIGIEKKITELQKTVLYISKVIEGMRSLVDTIPQT